MAQFIQPELDQQTASDAVVESFADVGLSRDAKHLAALYLAAAGEREEDSLNEREEEFVEYVARELARQTGSAASSEGVIVTAAQFLLWSVGRFRGWSPDRSELLARLVDHLAQKYADLSEALGQLFESSKKSAVDVKETGLLVALLGRDLVDPVRFIDVDAVRTTTKHAPGGPQWNPAAREADPALPEYWAGLDSQRIADACAMLVERESIGTLGLLALGLERCLDLRYPHKSSDLRGRMGPVTQILCRRKRTESSATDELLTRCCWSYAELAGHDAASLLPEDHAVLSELALAELGRMRSSLRGEGDGKAFEARQPYLHHAVFFLLRTRRDASIWDVLRRLLLALREVEHRTVPLDLRTWDEAGLERMPQPWGWIPNHIANVLELFLAEEVAREEDLDTLRREFGKFCLDRLKTRDKPTKTPGKRTERTEPVTNDELVERGSIWRRGYIRAAQELHPSLGAHGYRVLAWSEHNDPDEEVRVAAKTASEVIRHSHGLPADTSPRRAVYAAFWWLRQAHVFALGETPERNGAQRTYRKEMRRQPSDKAD